MKALCFQGVVRRHLWELSHVRALSRRLPFRHQGMCLGSCFHKECQGAIGGSKGIDLYAFSWGIPRNQHELWLKQHNGKVSCVESLSRNVSLAGQCRRQCTDIGTGLALPSLRVRRDTLHELAEGSEACLCSKSCSRGVQGISAPDKP
jgi:hypothetical protein